MAEPIASKLITKSSRITRDSRGEKNIRLIKHRTVPVFIWNAKCPFLFYALVNSTRTRCTLISHLPRRLFVRENFIEPARMARLNDPPLALGAIFESDDRVESPNTGEPAGSAGAGTFVSFSLPPDGPLSRSPRRDFQVSDFSPG